MSSTVIQCFEHDSLSLDEKFQKRHFNALAAFSFRKDNLFFAVGHNRIKFRNYVGVIQVGDLTIEILPKLDRDSKVKAKEHLIEMLHIVGALPLKETGPASLRIVRGSLFELYLNLFLQEVQRIVSMGIQKRYSLVQGNERFLRGHLLMNHQMTRNLFDKSRFYVEYQHYSKDHRLNQILKRALQIVAALSVAAAQDARNLLTFFEDVQNTRIQPQDFRRIKYTRNTECCRTAIDMAELIITNHQPDLQNGDRSITSFLFDMNTLFERYVAHEIQRQEKEGELHVERQQTKDFWRGDRIGRKKSIRPDIIIQHRGKTFILDTKWKLPDGEVPSDADLKQLYTYSLQWNADLVALVYPSPDQFFHSTVGFFAGSPDIHEERPISVWEVPLMKKDHLNRELGQDILDLLSTEPHLCKFPCKEKPFQAC